MKKLIDNYIGSRCDVCGKYTWRYKPRIRAQLHNKTHLPWRHIVCFLSSISKEEQKRFYEVFTPKELKKMGL